MASRFHGVPPSQAAAAAPPFQGIRAPPTVDESDSPTGSYYSGSEIESEGFESGEDERETVSVKSNVVEKDEGILEETQFVTFSQPSSKSPDEESVHESGIVSKNDVLRPSVRSPDEESVLESGIVSKNAVLRPSVRIPDEEFVQESGVVSKNVVLRPFIRVPDRLIYKGSSNVDDSDDSVSDSGDELVKEESDVVKYSDSRPLVAVKDEEVSRISPVQKLHIPVAKISADSDEDSQGSGGSDGEGFSGIVRIPSIEVLRRINSAPKVRILEFDGGEDDEDLVISNVVLGLSDEKEFFDAENSSQRDVLDSGDTVQDNGPDIDKEAMVNALVVNEEVDSSLESLHLDENFREIDLVDEQKMSVELVDKEGIDSKSESGQSGDAMHSDKEIREIDVIDEQKECVELVDKEETDSTSELGRNGDAMYLDEKNQENDLTDEEKECVELVDKEETHSTSEFGRNGDVMHLDEEIREIDVIDEHKKCVELVDKEEIDSTSESGRNGDAMQLDKEIREIDVIDEQKKCVELIDHRELADVSEDVIFPDNISDHSNRKEKVESEHKKDSIHRCVDIKEVPYEGCGGFPELPLSPTESAQVYMSDRLFKDARLAGVIDACQFVFEGSVLDQETRKEDENRDRLPCEVEESTSFSSGEISREIDGEIVADFHEEEDADGGTSEPAERTSDNFVPPSANGELGEALSERDEMKIEKIQQIREKYLRLLQKLGRSPEDSVASEVLHQLTLAERSPSSQRFHLDSTKKGDLDFSLSILVIGKTGVGKSATINSIFGEKKAVIDAFEPSTTHVKEIIGTIDGVELRIFDTPGLRSSFVDQSINRRILSSIKKLVRKSPPDIILYVDRLDTQTSPNDVHLLKSVTSYLGSSLWRRTVIAFTHGNSTPPDGPDGHPLSYELLVSQQSRIIRQFIGHSTTPVCVVENQEKNGIGESMTSDLLLSCYSIKILSELSSRVMELAPSSDGDRPYRYRFLEPSLRLLTMPVLDSPWDLDDMTVSSAGLSITFADVATRRKVKDRLAVGKRLGNGALVRVSVGRNSKLNVSVALRSDLRGSEQLQVAALAIAPIIGAVLKKVFGQSAED